MDIQYLYNTIAILCAKICSLDKQAKSKLYRSYWSNIEEDTKNLYVRFPILDPQFNSFDTLFDDINDEQWFDLLQHIEYSDEINLSLLSCLDRIVDLENGLKKFFSMSEYDINEFSALNNNVDVCGGKLIPKYTPKWKKARERSTSELGEKPLSILQNYIWINNCEDNGWKVNNLYSREWKYDGVNPFKIVCSPLVNRELFTDEKDTEGEIKYFYIKYFDDIEDFVAKRVEQTLDFAAEKEADIALFPEMVAYPGLHERIKKYVKQRWDKQYPKIIFLPSSEHNNDGKWKDVMYAIDSKGDNIFEYCKQHAYQLDVDEEIGNRVIKKKYFEPIQADHKVSIIHYEGVGRIGVCICSDLFSDELMNLLLKTYSVDLLLILSYSEGIDKFERRISMASDAVCDVVWCNCCAAYIDPYRKKESKNKKPAISYFPFGHAKKTDDYALLYRCSNDDCEGCSKCMKTVEIEPSYK